MLDKINYKKVSKSEQNIYYGKGADMGLGLVTTFAIVAIIVIVLYKLYGAKTGDISLPGGFKFKFTT